MIERILIAVLIRVTTYWVTSALEYSNKNNSKAFSERTIDERLEKVKAAYKDAFDGQPITPEQHKSLKSAVALFISNDSNGGL